MLHAAFRAHKMFLATALAPLIAAASTAPAPQPPSSPATLPPALTEISPAGQEVVPIIQPFDLDATQRMAVAVTVDGQGPFSFLVDTGAERTIIASELAERLKLANGGKLRLATIGSSSLVPSYQVASLAMTHLHLDPFEAPAFAGRHIGAAGLIGVDMLEKQRVVIDFRKETMQILETRRRAAPIVRDDDAIVVTARKSGGRLILSDARIGGRRIDIIVDTGAQTSVGNLALQQVVARQGQNRLPFYPTTLNAVSGESVPAVRTLINRITIGGLDVKDLPVSFVDADAFRALGLVDRPALLLGMDSLSLFDRVEIDFPNKRVVFDLPDAASRATGQRFAASTPPFDRFSAARELRE